MRCCLFNINLEMKWIWRMRILTLSKCKQIIVMMIGAVMRWSGDPHQTVSLHISKCLHCLLTRTLHYALVQNLHYALPLSRLHFRLHIVASSLHTCHLSRSCALDRFTKTFFWNFQSIPADLCYILIYKPMLEKVFCSNVAPSLSSGNHLFYKAEYMGQSCLN